MPPRAALHTPVAAFRTELPPWRAGAHTAAPSLRTPRQGAQHRTYQADNVFSEDPFVITDSKSVKQKSSQMEGFDATHKEAHKDLQKEPLPFRGVKRPGTQQGALDA